MKRLFFFAITLFTASTVFSQAENPVTWTFSAKKINDNVYEVQMVATIQNGWHLYSQTQPKDAIAEPTSFSFNKNPLFEVDGKVKEVGKLEKFKDPTLGVSAHQYSNKVTFIQKVKLKGKAKTNLTGSLRFQTCNGERCLLPKTVNVSVALQ